MKDWANALIKEIRVELNKLKKDVLAGKIGSYMEFMQRVQSLMDTYRKKMQIIVDKFDDPSGQGRLELLQWV